MRTPTDLARLQAAYDEAEHANVLAITAWAREATPATTAALDIASAAKQAAYRKLRAATRRTHAQVLAASAAALAELGCAPRA